MFSDLRYSWRRLRKSKGVSAAIVLTLGLCIGANSLVFSMLYGLVLKPLPFPESDRLVDILSAYPKSGQKQSNGNVIQCLDYAKHPDLFASVAVYHATGSSVGSKSGPIQVRAALVTPSFFDVLGIKPILGRFFDADNTTPGNDRYMVLTESYWKAHYNSDPEIVGKKVFYAGDYLTIVGVAPRSVEAFTPNLGMLTPISWSPRWFDDLSRHSHDFSVAGRVIARLQPGIDLQEAAARTTAIDRAFYDTASAAYKRFVDQSGYRSVVHYVHDDEVADQKDVLLLLQAGALLVLFIGCINVTNLLLARAAARQSELALRHALGASPWTLARQLLLETFLLSATGGLLGILVSIYGVRSVNLFGVALLPKGYRLSFDPVLVFFAFFITLAVCMFVGLAPIFFTVRKGLFQNIQQISHHASSSRGRRRLGAILVSGQVAFSAVLLVGAGLLIRSLDRASEVDPGYSAAQISSVRIILPASVTNTDVNRRNFQNRIIESLRQIPGVDTVGLATETPMVDLYHVAPIFIEGAINGPGTSLPNARFTGVSSDYFKAMGIRLLRGRPFDDRDLAGDAPSVIIDRTFSDRYFPGQNPIGRRVALTRMPTQDSQWGAIVGVAGITNYSSLDAVDGLPIIYIPIQKWLWAGNTFFVRSQRATRDMLPLIRDKILADNPELTFSGTGSLEQFVMDSLMSRRAILILLGSFAGLALLLACIGIYSVLAYDVAQRTREIGIRGAIGASHGSILALILRQGLWQVGLGLLVGLAGALLLGRLIQSLLFGVEPSDPITLVVITFLLLSIGFLASLIPAWRATRIDPIVALHCD